MKGRRQPPPRWTNPFAATSASRDAYKCDIGELTAEDPQFRMLQGQIKLAGGGGVGVWPVTELQGSPFLLASHCPKMWWIIFARVFLLSASPWP